MRTLSGAGQAAVAANNVSMAMLIEMDLDSGLLAVNHSRLDLTLNGITYTGTHGLGQVSQINDTSAQMPQLSFTMSGVPSSMVALALAEPVRGRTVTISLAVFDQTTGAVLDVVTRFKGYLDTMGIADGNGQAAVSVTAESGTRDLLRACNVLYSQDDQSNLMPGDQSWQFNADQVEQTIVFPARHWFIAHPS